VTTPTLFAAGLPFPEGPCFDRHGNLYVVDFGAGNISRLTPDGRAEVFARTGGSPTGLTFHPDGTLYVADTGLGAILRVEPDGTWSRVADAFAGPNDLAFDQDGRLYFTDPHGSRERDISIAGDRPTNVAFGGPDRRTLFITEVETSSLYTLLVPAPGLPLFAERAWARAGIV